jgi:hypothetical protein
MYTSPPGLLSTGHCPSRSPPITPSPNWPSIPPWPNHFANWPTRVCQLAKTANRPNHSANWPTRVCQLAKTANRPKLIYRPSQFRQLAITHLLLPTTHTLPRRPLQAPPSPWARCWVRSNLIQPGPTRPPTTNAPYNHQYWYRRPYQISHGPIFGGLTTNWAPEHTPNPQNRPLDTRQSHCHRSPTAPQNAHTWNTCPSTYSPTSVGP